MKEYYVEYRDVYGYNCWVRVWADDENHAELEVWAQSDCEEILSVKEV